MTKLLIDTDPGQDIDDLLALLFALQRPELDVRAITTVTWPASGRARLVRRLLRYLGREDIPVAAGEDSPLRPMPPEEMARVRVLGHAMNHASFAEPEDPRDDPGAEHAVDLIIRMAEAHPGELVLACIAPLTNIASALRREPGISRKIRHIALMGGETHLNRREHNIAFDYEAADVVLRSGIPIVMGSWDVTRRLVITKDECERFRRHDAPVNRALAEAIDRWHPAQAWKPGPVMYDLFPLVWAFDRTPYPTEPRHVVVETTGEHTRGMTIVGSGAPNVEVTVDARVDALRDMYLGTVLAPGAGMARAAR